MVLSCERVSSQIGGCSVVEDGGIPTACAAGPPVDCRRSAAGGDCSRGVAEGLRLSLELAEVRCPFLLVDTLDIFGSDLRVRHLLGDRGAVAESTCEAFRNDWSARDSASGVCLHIVDGREDAAAALAGRR
ncbi:hypothetical protein TcBrA4_0022190 [Trypanosoma cruzi]|nr:hypothetical protein TcBrA4_0022190 [Trypanosoma cruzi]